MIERRPELRDVSLLVGYVPEGVLNRVIQLGGIPETGPGRFSVPRALETALRPPLTQVPHTLATRRAWNRAHFK